MSQSRYEVLIGIGYDAASESRASAQATQGVRDLLKRMDEASRGVNNGGLINPAEIAKVGNLLKAEVDRAFAIDLRNSPLFKQMSNLGSRTPGRVSDQQLVRNAEPTNVAYSNLLKAQQNLVAAQQKREEVAARDSLTYGSKNSVTKVLPTSKDSYIAKPFADEASARNARISSQTAYNTANAAAVKARDDLVAEIQKSVTDERTARVNEGAARAKGTLAITQATAKREAAAAKALAAEEKADQDVRAAKLRGVFATVQAEAARRAAAEKAERDQENLRARETLAINKRTQQAEELSRRQAAAASARQTPISFPNADPSTRVGRAQETVNIAERNLASARYTQTEVARSETVSAQQVLSAENQLTASTRGLFAARQRLEDETIRAGNKAAAEQKGNNLTGQFALGFKGASDRPFAEQIGQAFKFSVFYGTAYKALFALTQTFQQTLQEGIQFQQAVTDLTLATGRTKEEAEDLAKSFAATSTEFGFSPSQAAEIGARAQGYYGTTEADKETQRRVGQTSAKVVQQIAFASGSQPADIQANLAAVTQAYQLGPQSQQYIGDLDAYFSKKFGIQQGQTISATSQAGVVGRAAGFDPAEVTALAADIISRTGASDAAAGGYLTQIFTRAGEGQLTALNSRYGISNQQDFAGQFRALAEVYAKRPDQRDDISAVFGRGKSQAAAISILQDFSNITDNVQKAKTEAPGELQRSSDLRLSDIGGQIQSTIGSLRAFAQELSQSGILDVVGGAVVVLREVTEGATELLKVFNLLPGPIKDVILGLAALAVATKVAAASETGAALGGGIRGGLGALTGGLRARSGLSLGREVSAAQRIGYFSNLQQAGAGFTNAAPLGQRVLRTAEGAAIPIGRGAGVGNNLRGGVAAARGGLAVAGGLGVLAAFAGDAVLIQKTMEASQKFAAARKDYIDFVVGKDYDLTTAEGNTAAADQATNLAQQSRDAAGGFFANYKNLGDDKDAAKARAKAADDLAKFYANNAKILSAATPTSGAGLINDLSDEGIQAALDGLARSGGTAADQMNLLADSVNQTADAASKALNNYDPELLAAQNSGDLYKNFAAAPGFFTGNKPTVAGSVINALIPDGSPIGDSNTTSETVTKLFSPQEIQRRLQGGLELLSSVDDLSDPKKFDAVVQEVVGNLPDKAKEAGFGQDGVEAVRTQLTQFVTFALRNIQDNTNNVSTTVRLTNDQLTFISDQTLQLLNNQLGDLPENNYNGRGAAIKKAISDLRGYMAHTTGGEQNAQANADLLKLQREQAANRYEQLEAMRKVAQQDAATQAESSAAGRRFARKEIRNAIKGRDADSLSKAIASTGEYARDAAAQAIDDAQKIAVAAAQAKQAAAAAAATITSLGLVIDGGVSSTLSPEQLATVNAPFDALKESLATTPSALPGAGVEGPTKGDIAAAKAAADAAKSQSAVAAASAQIKAAQVAVDQAKPGSVEWFNAQGQLATAQQGYASAVTDVADAKAAASAARQGGELASSAASITAAKNALANTAPGTAEYYNALASLYTAQQSLTQAIIGYQKNLFLLGHDATNPLVQARAETFAAAAQLRADIARGAGKDVIAEDRVNLQSAQASQESTKFQQRLDAVTTADNLQRISHKKYLAYLDHEHDRLTGIKNRTYQQQQELDQIDGLMKDAAQAMSGAFNFGDIKLPTPYEVRRKIAEEADALKNPTGKSTDNVVNGFNGSVAQRTGDTYISIDGADTAKVRSILTDVLGQRATTTTTSPRHR